MSTSEDVYPRFTARSLRTGEVVLYRVSGAAYDRFIRRPLPIPVKKLTVYRFPPRFRVKMDPASRQPVVLFDASRPAYRGRFYTLAGAMLAMDNVVRQERGMHRRVDWETSFSEGRAIQNAFNEEANR